MALVLHVRSLSVWEWSVPSPSGGGGVNVIALSAVGYSSTHAIVQYGFVMRGYGRLFERACDEAQAFGEIDAKALGEFEHVAACVAVALAN